MKVQVRKSALIGVVFLSLILMTGCGTLETLVKKDGTTTPLTEWIGASENKETSVPASTTAGEGRAVSLYFPDKSGQYLLKEERMLPKTLSLARETVNQWLKGPMETDIMQSSVSTATVLRDIAIRDNVVIVDLSKEFMMSNSKVSPEVALYGLVNTLTQFSTVKQVQIRIEGQPISKYGTIDATHLAYNTSLIKGNVSETTTVPNAGTEKTGLDVVVPSNSSNGSNGSNGVLSDSPSSINLFSYPPSST
ncbi:sporulation/spore germination protein [Desulfosporosinus orientis DSM 765]|uniref:Sporulation/spore germination protein n=1 Tax=Desulfosporosinus orientis (strain ATCC 19365 / DSM 765 / NCIMB 8382 / VKM B-1628 / Singapore I) TaxID=768706 RepID=G7W9V2_DESOD|nr:GerMN domain-containing protein [Desulfosporosinus orientis]AET70668.1 sporulation/spore germination protein [Desulfosporosinus orientis DSM 765]